MCLESVKVGSKSLCVDGRSAARVGDTLIFNNPDAVGSSSPKRMSCFCPLSGRRPTGWPLACSFVYGGDG